MATLEAESTLYRETMKIFISTGIEEISVMLCQLQRMLAMVLSEQSSALHGWALISNDTS